MGAESLQELEDAFRDKVPLGSIVQVFLKEGLMFKVDKHHKTARAVDAKGPAERQVTALFGKYHSNSDWSGKRMSLEFGPAYKDGYRFSVDVEELSDYDLNQFG